MKMITVNKLALGNLKARKKRYTLLIAGIILSMVFSSGITFFASTLITSLNERRYDAYGTQDVILYGVDEHGIEKLTDAGVITDTTYADKLGFIYKDEENKGSVVAKFNDASKKMFHLSVKEGRFPTDKGEIAVEAEALVRLGLDISVGDSFKCSFKASDGNGFLQESTEKGYTLVGILNDKRKYYEDIDIERTYEMHSAAVVSENETIDAGGRCGKIFFTNFAGNIDDSYGKLFDYLADDYPDMNITATGWMYDNAIAGISEIKDTSGLAITLAAVLMLASSIGIVNTFNSNLQDRKKQIGLLRAVGATRRQIITVFGREAFIIALICTPGSVLISYFATKIIITLMGELYVFKPKLWVLAICAAAGLVCVMAAALIPLLRVSRISPMLAIRNTEYTRKLRKKRIKNCTSFNVPKLISKRENSFSKGRIIAVSVLLTVSVLLSTLGFSYVQVEYENYHADNDYHLMNNSHSEFFDYGNRQPESFGLTNNILNEILASPYVKDVRYIETRTVNWLIDEPTNMQMIYLFDRLKYLHSFDYSDTSEMTPENFEKYYYDTKNVNDVNLKKVRETFGYGENILPCDLISADEATIEELKSRIIDGKIDIDKLNSGEEIILCIPRGVTYVVNCYDFGNGFATIDPEILNDDIVYHSTDRHIKKQLTFTTAKRDIFAGDEAELSLLMNTNSENRVLEDERSDTFFDNCTEHRKAVKIGAIIREGAIDDALGSYAYAPSFITTHKGYRSFGEISRPTSVAVNLKKECDEETNDSMLHLIEPLISGRNVFCNSAFSNMQDNESSRKTLIIALISVIILLFTLCASLVNNAMNARIRENKRQIGTLRAVGVSAKELNASYIRQMTSMFIYGLAGGFGIFNIFYVVLLIWSKYTSNDMPVDYFVLPSVILCALTFGICAFNLKRQIGKQMKYSIVDNIREL